MTVTMIVVYCAARSTHKRWGLTVMERFNQLVEGYKKAGDHVVLN